MLYYDNIDFCERTDINKTSASKECDICQYLIVCSYHVTYAFQNESTLCICLNVKELLARSRPEI